MEEANGVPIKQVGGEIFQTTPATVNLGVEVGPGKYQVGKCQPNGHPGTGYVKPDKSGNFTSCADPTKGAGAEPQSPLGGGPGGGGNLGGGGLGGALGGNLGGLAAMLPLLMQMLGQGGGQQGGQNPYGNNPYGAGYGDPQTQVCAQQPISPVCGQDGRTYKNQCYAQQYGAIVASNGVCPASPTPTPAADTNLAGVLGKLPTSGIPQSILDSIRTLVASILSNIRSGAPVSETVVR